MGLTELRQNISSAISLSPSLFAALTFEPYHIFFLLFYLKVPLSLLFPTFIHPFHLSLLLSSFSINLNRNYTSITPLSLPHLLTLAYISLFIHSLSHPLSISLFLSLSLSFFALTTPQFIHTTHRNIHFIPQPLTAAQPLTCSNSRTTPKVQTATEHKTDRSAPHTHTHQFNKLPCMFFAYFISGLLVPLVPNQLFH